MQRPQLPESPSPGTSPSASSDVSPDPAPGLAPDLSTIAAILVFQTCALFGRAWLETTLTDTYGVLAAPARNASYLIVPPVLALLAAPILIRHRSFLAGRLPASAMTWRLVLLGVGLGLALRVAWWSGLVTWASLDRGGADEPLFWLACPPVSHLALHLLALGLLAPVVEEIVNRGFVLHGLLRFGQIPAVLGSAALFAVFHRSAALLPVAAVGLALGMAALRAGVLWPTIAAHATWNALIALDWLCLHGIWVGTPATSAWRWAYLVSAPTLAAALCACAWLVRRMAPAASSPPAPAEPT